jgi:hypothetical protein
MCVKTSSLATTPFIEGWGHGGGGCFFHRVFLDVRVPTTMDLTLLSTNFLFKSRYEKQKKLYSGKPKNHTLKNPFIVTPNRQGRVDVVVGKPVHTSDLNIGRSSKIKTSFLHRFKLDKGYVGATFIDTREEKTSAGRIQFQIKAKESRESYLNNFCRTYD